MTVTGLLVTVGFVFFGLYVLGLLATLFAWIFCKVVDRKDKRAKRQCVATVLEKNCWPEDVAGANGQEVWYYWGFNIVFVLEGKRIANSLDPLVYEKLSVGDAVRIEYDIRNMRILECEKA